MTTIRRFWTYALVLLAACVLAWLPFRGESSRGTALHEGDPAAGPAKQGPADRIQAAASLGSDVEGRTTMAGGIAERTSVRVLSMADDAPVVAASIRYLSVSGGTWGEVQTDSNGTSEEPLPSDAVIEITGSGYFGIQLDLAQERTGDETRTIRLFPAATLGVTLKPGGSTARTSEVTLVAFPHLDPQAPPDVIARELVSPSSRSLRALRDNHQLSSFFANLRDANPDVVSQVLRQAPFSHLRGGFGWSGYFPDGLGAPSSPFPWVRQTNGDGVALWLELPAGVPLRWSVQEPRLRGAVEIEPPYELQEITGVAGGFSVAHGVPEDISGTFTLAAAQVLLFEATVRAQGGIRGTIRATSDGLWIEPPVVMLFAEETKQSPTGQRLWDSQGEWSASTRGDGTFVATDIEPGEKTLCAYWKDTSGRYWFASKGFAFDAEGMHDLGDIWPNGDSIVVLDTRFEGPSGESYSPAEVLDTTTRKPCLNVLVKERSSYSNRNRMHTFIELPVDEPQVVLCGLRDGSYSLSATIWDWFPNERFAASLADHGGLEFELAQRVEAVFLVEVKELVEARFEVSLDSGVLPASLQCQLIPLNDRNGRVAIGGLAREGETCRYAARSPLPKGDVWVLACNETEDLVGLGRAEIGAGSAPIPLRLQRSCEVVGTVKAASGGRTERRNLFFRLAGVGHPTPTVGFHYSTAIAEDGSFALQGVLPNSVLILCQDLKQTIQVGAPGTRSEARFVLD